MLLGLAQPMEPRAHLSYTVRRFCQAPGTGSLHIGHLLPWLAVFGGTFLVEPLRCEGAKGEKAGHKEVRRPQLGGWLAAKQSSATSMARVVPALWLPCDGSWTDA